MKNKLIYLIFLFTTVLHLIAQNKTEIRLTLYDGNSISGTTKLDKIIFNTAYGKLDIPINHVSLIKIGIAEDASQKANVINLLKQLNNPSESIRKNAYENLIKLNAGVIPIIENAIYNDASINSSSYSDYTVESVLSELKSTYGIDESTSMQDIISIDGEYTIGGRYEFSKIDLTTEYGNLVIPREKIRLIEILYSQGNDNNDKVFKLMGSKHISSNKDGGWLKTGIMVKNGQRITILANGQVTFASLSGSTYKPDGKIAGSTNADDIFETLEGATYGDDSYLMYGNVVFKIGENGKIQKAGTKYSGFAKQTGMLYLSIYETVYNPANTGSYNVKVSVK
ncbi:MAG: hypothetical protein ACK4IK_08670 [Bacteroidia bacterium]